MNTRNIALAVTLAGGLGLAVSSAYAHCGSCGEDDSAAADHKHECAASCENECCAESGHALTGEIVNVDAKKRMLVVRHEAIPDVMGAMTMGFAVTKNFDLSSVQAGDRIHGRLVREGNAFLLKLIEKDEKASS